MIASVRRTTRYRWDTKLFLVALVLCRPWLLDPSRSTPLPTTPEIARSVLELTSASRELQRFETDGIVRHQLTEQIGDHLKYLRKKITVCGLASAGTRLSRVVVAETLLANDIITAADMLLLEAPDWRSWQENLWWREDDERC